MSMAVSDARASFSGKLELSCGCHVARAFRFALGYTPGPDTVAASAAAVDLGRVSRREVTEEGHRQLGFLIGARFADWSLQVGNAVGGDDDQLPALVAGLVEQIKIGRLTRRIVEVDLAVFPRDHVRWPTLKARRSRGRIE